MEETMRDALMNGNKNKQTLFFGLQGERNG